MRTSWKGWWCTPHRVHQQSNVHLSTRHTRTVYTCTRAPSAAFDATGDVFAVVVIAVATRDLGVHYQEDESEWSAGCNRADLSYNPFTTCLGRPPIATVPSSVTPRSGRSSSLFIKLG